MSSRTRTLQQLIDGVSDRADVSIASSGVRHTTSLVTARINKAIQKWIVMAAEAGDDTTMLTYRTATATSTVRDAKNWAPYQYVAQPSSCMLVRGIDVWTGTTPVAMMKIDELERDDAQLATTWWNTGGTNMPVFYRIGGTNNAGDSLIQIFPWADAVYTVDIRYIPALTDLSSPSDSMDFVCGGDEWVANDAAMQTLLSDGLSGGAEYANLRGENRELADKLAFTMACRGGLRKIDTRERRRLLRELSCGPWRLI